MTYNRLLLQNRLYRLYVLNFQSITVHAKSLSLYFIEEIVGAVDVKLSGIYK